MKSKIGKLITNKGENGQSTSQKFTRENSVTKEALDDIECLPVLEELDSNPTEEEHSKVIDALACGKALGEDGIPPEILKCGKLTSLKSLHSLLSLCWREEKVPQDMCNVTIILYKNKGDCNISLLSICLSGFSQTPRPC